MSLSLHFFLDLLVCFFYLPAKELVSFCLPCGTARILDPDLPLQYHLWKSWKAWKIVWLAISALPQGHPQLPQWGHAQPMRHCGWSSSRQRFIRTWLQDEHTANISMNWNILANLQTMSWASYMSLWVLASCTFILFTRTKICFLQYNMHYGQYYSSEKGAVSFLPPSFLLGGRETQSNFLLTQKKELLENTEIFRLSSPVCYGSSP